MKNRIREIRTEKNLSIFDLSEKTGTTPQQISRIERGERSLDTEWIARISKALNVKPYELLPREWQPNGTKHIKVVGYVQAGAWQEANQWDENDFYNIAIPQYPEYSGKHLYALEVRGESMNEVYPAGTCVVCISIDEWDKAIDSGKKVVVERVNPNNSTVEATVKEYVQNESGIFLCPKSRDPSFQTIKIDETTGDTSITGIVIGSFRKE